MRSESRETFFFLPDFTAGGAERATIRVANELVARGCKVTLLVLKARGPLREEVSSELPCIELGVDSLPRSLPSLYRALRRHPTAIVFAVMMQPSFVMLLLKATLLRRLKVIPIEHSCFTSWRERLGRPKFLSYRLLYSVLYRWADAVVCVGREMMKEMKAVLPAPARSRIVTIYNPIVSHELDGRAEAEEGPGAIESGRPTIVFAGRLSREKNVGFLIEVVRRLIDDGASCELQIVGDGPERERLEGHVARRGLRGHVRFIGHTANPYPLIAKADVLALCSVAEGFPTVLVEALYLGTPVVATACRTGPREIISDARLGRVTEEGDIEGYADALRGVLRRGGIDADYMRSYAARYDVMSSADGYAALIDAVD